MRIKRFRCFYLALISIFGLIILRKLFYLENYSTLDKERRVFAVIPYETPYDFTITRIVLRNPGKLVSWENSQLGTEKPETDRGEDGETRVLDDVEKRKDDETFGHYGYSVYRSDRISITRTIPDSRNPDCRTFLYHKNLPKASIILPFHNEAKSVLLRSAASIVNQSPPDLIKDIIFVDDDSTNSDLKHELIRDFKKISGKIKVVRPLGRLGLIQAKSYGVSYAEGDVYVFLDSHIEVNKNWLPPLLHQIALNYRSVPQPTIDDINKYTFKYKSSEGALDGLRRGSFDWTMNYKKVPIPEVEQKLRKSEAYPFFNPVQCGGLFAIHKKWWEELKGYDPYLAIWGGEQYEMSFKVWMCHGEMQEVPCSRVGHIFRGRLTVEFSPHAAIEKSMVNIPRVAHVWMDEYKEHYFERRPNRRFSNLKDGIEDRLEIRDRLRCNTFDWYMKHVAFDQPLHYPAVEPDSFAQGKVKSLQFLPKCLNQQDNFLILGDCAKDPRFELTWRKEFVFSKNQGLCLDSGVHRKVEDRNLIGFYNCHRDGGNQFWLFNSTTRQIRQKWRDICLATDGQLVYTDACDSNSENQKWVFDHVDMSNYRADLWPHQ